MTSGLLKVEQGPDSRLKVDAPPYWQLAAKPKRVLPGHGACPGCGIFPALDQFLRGIEGDVVVLYQTGCAMVVSTGYPYTSHRITYVHNLFQNGASGAQRAGRDVPRARAPRRAARSARTSLS